MYATKLCSVEFFYKLNNCRQSSVTNGHYMVRNHALKYSSRKQDQEKERTFIIISQDRYLRLNIQGVWCAQLQFEEI